MKKTLIVCAFLSIASTCGAQLTAAGQGSNDFFGSSPNPGTGQGADQRVPGANAAEQALNNNPSDYTSDEKRMQKKYKLNVLLAQRLVTKGESMMKDGEKRKDQKALKKGKILKEIGEKRLAELKESNPLPTAK